MPRPIIKPHPEEKLAWPRARKAPIYLGFPFNISATAALRLSVSGASCFSTDITRANGMVSIGESETDIKHLDLRYVMYCIGRERY